MRNPIESVKVMNEGRGRLAEARDGYNALQAEMEELITSPELNPGQATKPQKRGKWRTQALQAGPGTFIHLTAPDISNPDRMLEAVANLVDARLHPSVITLKGQATLRVRLL